MAQNNSTPEISNHEKRYILNETLGIGALILQTGPLEVLKKEMEELDKKKYVELLNVIIRAKTDLQKIAPQFHKKQLASEKVIQPQI